MDRLITLSTSENIPRDYAGTPIGKLIEYHNHGKPFEKYLKAELLIGMCMDNRKHINIPDNFSFIIRTGGANLRYSEFKVSFAISVGGIRHVALIGHTNCGMVNLSAKKEQFINGLVENAGWNEKDAAEHFSGNAPKFEIENEIDFISTETKRLRVKYPKIMFAPMLYKVEDNKLYLIEEKK